MRTVTFSDKRVAEAVAEEFVPAWGNRVDGFHDCSPVTENHIFRDTAEAYGTRNICTFFLTPDLQVLHYVAGTLSPALFLEEMTFASRLRERVFDESFKARAHGRASFLSMHEDRACDLKERIRTLAGIGAGPRSDETARQWFSILDRQGTLKYDGSSHTHTDACAWTLRTHWEHRVAVHADLAAGRIGTAKPHCTVPNPVGSQVTVPEKQPKKIGWLGTQIDVTHARKRPPAEPPTPHTLAETKSADFLPVFSELRENYLFGNTFAEEHSRKKVVSSR